MARPLSSRQRERQFHEKTRAKASSDGEAKKSKWGSRKYLRDYVRWLYPYRFSIAGVLVLALIGAALDMVWPLAIKSIVDRLAAPGAAGLRVRGLNVWGGSVLALLLVKQFLDSYRSYRTT